MIDVATQSDVIRRNPTKPDVIITLSRFEVFQAAMIGVRRRLEVMGSATTNKVGNAEFGWHTDIESACAEMAVAKVLGTYWSGGVNTWKAGDVGQFQVRHTTYDNGCLIYRRGDPERDVYILVTGIAPKFVVRGWVTGAEAQQGEFWRSEGYGAWWVPQSRLHPVESLLI